jgi:hypothetical protein
VDLILPYLSILTLLGLFSGPQEPVEVPEQQPWSVLWRSLAAEPGPLERAKLVSAWEPRLNVRAAGEGSAERYRRQLARNALGLEHRDLPALVPEPSYLGAPVEAWIAARFRPADRVRLVSLGIGEEGLSREQEKRRLQRGFEIFLELEGDFQVGAREVAEALHRRAHATWSAFCLEGIQRRCGSLDLALDTVNSMLPPRGKAQGRELFWAVGPSFTRGRDTRTWPGRTWGAFWWLDFPMHTRFWASMPCWRGTGRPPAPFSGCCWTAAGPREKFRPPGLCEDSACLCCPAKLESSRGLGFRRS